MIMVSLATEVGKFSIRVSYLVGFFPLLYLQTCSIFEICLGKVYLNELKCLPLIFVLMLKKLHITATLVVLSYPNNKEVSQHYVFILELMI